MLKPVIVEPCKSCRFKNDPEQDMICENNKDMGRAIITGKCKYKEEENESQA